MPKVRLKTHLVIEEWAYPQDFGFVMEVVAKNIKKYTVHCTRLFFGWNDDDN
jgi:hypothetical protein